MNQTAKPTISAIAAMDENRTIGFQNKLPWHLPADLKYFKSLTKSHPIIMGRKTHSSIGRPLPNRANIVVSSNQHFQADGCLVVTSIESAIEKASAHNTTEIFIIGGATIYQQSLSFIQRIYLTLIHHSFPGDTFFPELDQTIWHEVSREKHHADEENNYSHSFIVYER